MKSTANNCRVAFKNKSTTREHNTEYVFRTGVLLACLISIWEELAFMSTAFKSSSSPWMWVNFHLNPHSFLLFWRWSYLLCVCSSRLVMTDNNAEKCQVSFTWLYLQDPPENLCQIYVRKWLVAVMLTTWGLCTAEVFCHCFFSCRDFKVLLSARAGIPQHRTVVVMPNVVCSLHI